MASPLVPAAYDVLWTVVTLALLAGVVALIATLLIRSGRNRREIAALRADVDRLKGQGDGPTT